MAMGDLAASDDYDPERGFRERATNMSIQPPNIQLSPPADWNMGALAAFDRYQPADDPWSQKLPDVGEPLIGSGPQVSAGLTPIANVTEGLTRDIPRGVNWFLQQARRPAEEQQAAVRNFLGSVAGNAASLPQRAFESAEQLRNEGVYDPGPILEAASLPMGTGAMVGVRGAGAVLGAGPVRRMGDILGTAGYNAPHEAASAITVAKAPLDVTGGLGGIAGGEEGLRQAGLQAERRAAGVGPLAGLPTPKTIIDGQYFVPGPVGSVHDVANAYMADKNFGIAQPDRFHPVDPERAAAIAKAYDALPMFDPAALPSYDALIAETKAQYQAIKNSGLRLTPVDATTYPYHDNPRAVVKDIADNNHMAFFKTEEGFGTGNDALHPLLRPSGESVGDYPLLNNDLFRIVHDYMGHAKNGNGFRAAGEDNAWRAHAAMYSDLARAAMTTETRGQNSWLNYGPHGESNRTASALDTIYAPQKVALLPDWVTGDLQRTVPAAAKPDVVKPQTLFDYSKLGDVPNVSQFDLPRYEPPRGVSERVQDLVKNPDVRDKMLELMQSGHAMGGSTFYGTEPLRDAFIAELGRTKGPENFARYMDYVAATSPRSKVPENARNASYYYGLEKRGEPVPPQGGENPEPYGHFAQNLHRLNAEKIRSGEYFDVINNPKPLSFSQNLQGNLRPVTVDAHAFSLPAMLSQDPRFLQGSFKPAAGMPTINPAKMYAGGKLSMEQALQKPTYWATKPNPNEYMAMEDYYKSLSREFGYPEPALGQGATWSGGGHITGLGSPAGDPFIRAVENRANITAKQRGISPEEALSRMIRGKEPLLAVPPVMGGLAAQDNYEPQ